MTTAIQAADALYPPTVTPPPAPLPLGKFALQIVRNPLLVLPQAAYEEPILSVARGRFQYVWVTGPELIEEVLVKRAQQFSKTPVEKRVFRRTLKDGVLSSDGQLWRWQRRTMAPLFRPAEILNYVPSMAQPAEDLLARWRGSPRGSVQKIDADMTEATFAVIARTMLKGGEPAEADLIKRETALSLAYTSWEIMYGVLRFPAWLPHPGSWILSRSAKNLRRAVHDIIARRQAEGGRGGDLLGRLLDARDPETGEPMTMEQLINNLLTLLEAGHETTARALSWTLYLMARAPEWQDRVRAEVLSVCADGPIEAEHIAALPLTQQVLKESMRLYPPVPAITRIAVQDTRLGDQDIWKHSFIVIPIFCVHRHKMLWSDPARFDPARFEPEREAAYPRTQFMPFGAGPRVCLGSSFAMAEATVILASLIRAARFEWDGKHSPEPVSRVTLRPRGGMPLKVTMLEQPPLRYA
jgi:cytochrome P450